MLTKKENHFVLHTHIMTNNVPNVLCSRASGKLDLVLVWKSAPHREAELERPARDRYKDLRHADPRTLLHPRENFEEHCRQVHCHNCHHSHLDGLVVCVQNPHTHEQTAQDLAQVDCGPIVAKADNLLHLFHTSCDWVVDYPKRSLSQRICCCVGISNGRAGLHGLGEWIRKCLKAGQASYIPAPVTEHWAVLWAGKKPHRELLHLGLMT